MTPHVPSASGESGQPPVVAVATKVHVAVSTPFVAVIRTVAPTTNPVASIVGVVSEVMESEFESPRSEAVATIGVPVTGIAIRPMLGESSFAVPESLVAVVRTRMN